MAAANATKATQKCASTSFLARNTAHPLSALGLGEELVGRPSPARGPTSPRGPCRSIRGRASAARRPCSKVVVKVATKPGISITLALVLSTTKPWMASVAGRAEGDGHAGRHHQALRLERILLRDQAHHDLAVRTRPWCPGCSRRTRRLMCSVRGSTVSTREGGIAAQCSAREDHHRDQHGDDEHDDDGPAPFRARRPRPPRRGRRRSLSALTGRLPAAGRRGSRRERRSRPR